MQKKRTRKSTVKRRRSAPRARGGLSSPACSLHELEEAGTATPPGVRIKRIYEGVAPDDGFRVLVDRLWPRGISRRAAALDAWVRDIAPSTALRKWFGHDARRWKEFRSRYLAELRAHAETLEALRLRASRGRLTLLTSTKEPRYNHAVVLAEVLRGRRAVRRARAESSARRAR